jgi:hypothetical protein
MLKNWEGGGGEDGPTILILGAVGWFAHRMGALRPSSTPLDTPMIDISSNLIGLKIIVRRAMTTRLLCKTLFRQEGKISSMNIQNARRKTCQEPFSAFVTYNVQYHKKRLSSYQNRGPRSMQHITDLLSFLPAATLAAANYGLTCPPRFTSVCCCLFVCLFGTDGNCNFSAVSSPIELKLGGDLELVSQISVYVLVPRLFFIL